MQYYSFMENTKWNIEYAWRSNLLLAKVTEKNRIHYLLFIQLSDSWFMIRLDLNISCPRCSLFMPSNAWSADTWLKLNDVEIMFCHVYLLIDVLMSLRYHSFDKIIMLMQALANHEELSRNLLHVETFREFTWSFI